jgi:hypothetical protein
MYAALYPGKIIYSKNSINTKDRNFELSLSKGKGEYLKLNTDYQEHLDGSLEFIVNEIKANLKYKPNLFFMNGALGLNKKILNSGRDQFLSFTSYYSTWIGMYGIWRSDFESIKEFGRAADLQLAQLDNIYRVLAIKPDFVIMDVKIFRSANLKSKRNYDLLTVFLDNYNQVLSSHVEDGGIKQKTLHQDIKKILLMFICGWAARSSLGLDASFVIERHWQKIFRYCNPDLPLFAHYTCKYFKNWCFFLYERSYRQVCAVLFNRKVLKE